MFSSLYFFSLKVVTPSAAANLEPVKAPNIPSVSKGSKISLFLFLSFKYVCNAFTLAPVLPFCNGNPEFYLPFFFNANPNVNPKTRRIDAPINMLFTSFFITF